MGRLDLDLNAVLERVGLSVARKFDFLVFEQIDSH